MSDISGDSASFQDSNVDNSFYGFDHHESPEFELDKPVEQQHKKVIDKEERSIIESAKEILELLDQNQRTDLTLHLYSSYLLRTLLYKANEKRHFSEVDLLYKTQVKENWISWPNSNTIIDPKTDKLYEDDIGRKPPVYDEIMVTNGQVSTQAMKQQELDDMNLNFDVFPGEVSTNALIHGSKMLEREMNAYWQNTIARSAKLQGEYLDVDAMNMPSTISDHILGKLDLFFEGLHNQVAQRKNIDIKQDSEDGHIVISQPPQTIDLKENKHIELDFHDIILRSSDMGEDMQEIYMKCLQLFNDIPKTFDKQHFKLPKEYLQKFSPPPSTSNLKLEEVLNKSKKNFVAINDVLKNPKIKSKQKLKLALKNRKNAELNINKKVFYKIQGPDLINLNELEYDLEDTLL